MDGNGIRKDGSCSDGMPVAGVPLNGEAEKAVKAAMARFRGAIRRAMAEEGRGVLAGFVNHSGGAVGSDHAWDVESRKFGAVSKHWYRGSRTPFGNAPMSDADFLESEETAQAAARRMCRGWSRNPWVQNLVRRNWCQAKYADAVYAVGHIQWDRPQSPAPVQVKGGTGYAVQMALDLGKPVWVFNLDNGRWHDALDGWTETDPPILVKRFAGIGTRGDAVPNRAGLTALPDVAWNAIRDVCERTVANQNQNVNIILNCIHSFNYIKSIKLYANILQINNTIDNILNLYKENYIENNYKAKLYCLLYKLILKST